MGNQITQQLLRDAVIQPKLTVSKSDDKFEQEADRVPEQVMRMPDSAATVVRRSSKPPLVQRLCAECDEELHRKAGPGPERVGKGFKHPSNGRRRLPDTERRFFESRLGRDLSPV